MMTSSQRLEPQKIKLELLNIYYSIFQIYTNGCIQRIQSYVEQNLYLVGGVALGIAVAQLLGKEIGTT